MADRYFFLHIPKTAGTSFRHMLYDIFPDTELLPNASELKGNGGFYFGYERIKQLPVTRFKTCRLIHGHLPYSMIDFFDKRPKLLVFLRNPVDRALSRVLKCMVRGKIGNMDIRGASLLNVVEDVNSQPELANVQTKVLAGIDYRVNISLEDKDLEQAKEHLKQCQFIGITERFDESIQLCEHIFQWNFPNRYFLNVAAKDERCMDILNKCNIFDYNRVRKIIAGFNELDIELYKYALDEFEERLRRMPSRNPTV